MHSRFEMDVSFFIIVSFSVSLKTQSVLDQTCLKQTFCGSILTPPRDCGGVSEASSANINIEIKGKCSMSSDPEIVQKLSGNLFWGWERFENFKFKFLSHFKFTVHMAIPLVSH